MRQEFEAIDAHVGGAPVRLLVRGVARPSGKTMDKKRTWLERRADHVRRATILEPRGQRDLVGVLLTEPVSAGADAGLLFLDAAGYPRLNGAAVVAAATIALERGLVTKAGPADPDSVRLVFDTPAGTVTALSRFDRDGVRPRVSSVNVTGLSSFVVDAGCDIVVGARRLRVDLAYGGAFYALVDSETAGVALTLERLADVRRLGAEICSALEGHDALVYPGDTIRSSLGGVIITAPPHAPDAHLRSVTVASHGGCDRSPGVTATAAVMAVLDAMGLLQVGEDFVHEGLLGLPERGRVIARTQIADKTAIVPEVESVAWITGEQTLVVDGDDPLRDGFLA